MTLPLFVFGTLLNEELREVVAGGPVAGSAAYLPEHAVCTAKDQAFPLLVPTPGARAEGQLLQGFSGEAAERIDFYESLFEYTLREVVVVTQDGLREAQVYMPPAGRWISDGPWHLEEWARTNGRINILAAKEIMERRHLSGQAELVTLYPFIRARAHSRQMAETTTKPTTIRRHISPGDVTILSEASGHEGFFRIKQFTLQQTKFDGTPGPILEREAFLAFDAALVLPYDPARDLVLLIEQLRFAPLWRGDPQPYMLEPVAGLVDAGEDPADAARREAEEEAGVALSELLPLISGYPAPGYVTEYHHCYLGLCDLDPDMAGLGGLASENEDIRSHILPFDEAMALVDSGEITATPLALMLLLLSRKRDGLRAST
ncbi:NUDIX domain-containing protein [Primorskyibacter sp. S187A]|uniref:NUDIX domain-containing protein n=1 Tax=Primorskyibacter sp. S187A TaxID=3415130 RepID=UPI003C79FB5D